MHVKSSITNISLYTIFKRILNKYILHYRYFVCTFYLYLFFTVSHIMMFRSKFLNWIFLRLLHIA